MTAQFAADFSQFKQLASEFFRALPKTTRAEQIQAGLKCLGIAFLEFTGDENERHQAEIVLSLAHRKGGEREREILYRELLSAPSVAA